MSNFSIQDESNFKYYSCIPNIIVEIGLKANAIALYLAIKKSSGDHGECTKSTMKLAKEAGINKKTLFKVLEQLCEVNPILKKPLISCLGRITESGDKDTNLIKIIDIWPENFAHFDRGGVKTVQPGVKLEQGGVKLEQGVVLKRYNGGVKTVHKQEPFKNNPIKKQQQAAVFFDCLIKDSRLDDENRKSLMSFPEERVKLALEYSLQVPSKKTLIQQLMWHCALVTPPKIPTKSFWDQVKEYFKNEGKYNGATCYIDSEGISFERGITHLNAKFADPSGKVKLESALKQFGIKWSCL